MGIISASLCFLLIAYYSLRNSNQVKSQDEYLLAGRHTKLLPLIATLVMTEFNTGTLISFSSLGYLAGYWALAMPFIFLIGLLFYTLTVAKKWKQFNGVSVAHFFATRYGRKLELLVAGVLFLAMLGFSAAYIKSLTLLMLPLIPINSLVLSAALVIVILLLTLRGGLSSIIALDVLSFIFVIIFFPLLVYFSYHLPQSNQIPAFNLAQMQALLPPKFIISLIILTMFSYIIAPWYGQKIVAAKTQQTAYFAAAIAAIIIFLLYGLAILATVILRSKGVKLTDIQLGLPYLIRNALPHALQGVAYVVLFFVAASTLAGVWNAMVTLIVGSIFKSNSGKVNSNILWVLICAIIAYIIANSLIDNILSKMILFNIPIVAFCFALLAGFYWSKANSQGAYVSILAGIIWGVFCYFYVGEAGNYTWYWAIYGIPLIFISGISASLFGAKKS
ncbi:MAG: hypothetical protein K2X04_01950 [Burkholderiales bacterium]|nr:hypothetical protein [Burkholderiales bacterium]